MEHRGIFMLAVGAAAVAAIVTALQPKPVISRTDAAKAAKAGQAVSLPAEVSLAPGESLVTQPSSDDPLMPHYATPTPPPPAPKVADEPSAPPAPPVASPAPAARRAPRPEPSTPSFARGDAHPTSPFDTWPNPSPAACANCGQVEALTVWPDMAEVRVRLESGAVRTVRTSVPPQWHIGEHVRFERGRLVRD